MFTNRSSGKTAVNLVNKAFLRGADVEFWYGDGKEPSPNYIKTLHFSSIKDLNGLIKKHDIKKFHIIILSAALSDYLPKKIPGKIPSQKNEIEIKLTQAPKIISKLKSLAPKTKIIGFKLEYEVNKVKRGSIELLKKNSLDFVVGNTIQGFEKDENEIWIFNKKEEVFHKKANKAEISDYIFDIIK